MSDCPETSVVSAVLAELGFQMRGPVKPLPTAPAGEHRRVLHVPVLGFGRHATVRSVVVKLVPSVWDVEARALRREHQIGWRLHALAASYEGQNPVPKVLHPDPLEVADQLVSVRQYIDAKRPICARELGGLLGRLHRVGALPGAKTLLESRPGSPSLELDLGRVTRALQRPGHPFGTQPLLGQRIVRALEARVARAQDLGLAAGEPPLVVHRDLHPANAVLGHDGPVALDWAEAGWGARGEDFAWLHVAVTRFGADPSVLDHAFAGYQDVAGCPPPSQELVRAWGQVRELVCLAYSVQNAGRSGAHLREARIELPILDDADAETAHWTTLFNPAAFAHPVLSKGSRQIDSRRRAS